jgi:hypothetical protein
MLEHVVVRPASSLSALPIEVAEAMYSPDFVELSSLSAGGTPLSLPMSFTLDLPGGCFRFSSPVTAGRLANYTRDPRCSVLCSRVTTGFPPVLVQGLVSLGEVMPGVTHGPARRFTVTPVRVVVLDTPLTVWHTGDGPRSLEGSTNATPLVGRSVTPGEGVPPADLEALARLPSTIVTLRDDAGWPLALPAELTVSGSEVTATLPAARLLRALPGRASVLGHTWSKDGPRYLAASGHAALDGDRLTFHPARLLRRGL